MYCFTYVNGLTCVLNELFLWSEISKEHPIFIKTVAQLTNKNLPQSLTDKLTAVTEMFDTLEKQAHAVNNQITDDYYAFYYLPKVKELVEEFLLHDEHFLQVLPQVKHYGKNDAVWQELLEHITKEQNFMYKLFSDIRTQLANY